MSSEYAVWGANSSGALKSQMGPRHIGQVVFLSLSDKGESHFKTQPSPNMWPQGSVTGRSGWLPERNGS